MMDRLYGFWLLFKKVRPVSILNALGVCFALSLVLTSCYNDVVIPQEPPVSGSVSFSGDIIPIFNAKCNGPGCHNQGGIAPNLTPGAAYSALQAGYVSVQDPSNSELYQWMVGNRSVPMPPSGSNSSDNAKVLAWIQQGALNN